MATREENLKKINEQLEQLTDEQLDQVAGGTVKEYEEICSAMANNPILKSILETGSHVPISNQVDKVLVEDILKVEMGIKADISLGFLGTGLGSKSNTYKDLRNGGRSMTHAEVINRIKQYAI